LIYRAGLVKFAATVIMAGEQAHHVNVSDF
jgi:hypothetical protein